MNQDTEWYGNRPYREQSSSADNINEPRQDELQHRLGPERRSQSYQDLPVAGPSGMQYQGTRYQDPWVNPHRDPVGPERRSQSDPDFPVAGPSGMHYQRARYEDSFVNPHRHSHARMENPNLARWSSAPSFGWPSDRPVYYRPPPSFNPGMPPPRFIPPPPIEIPVFDPTRPPPPIVPAARHHERNIFDALPPPPPPPPFEYGMTPQGHVLAQPLPPRPQMLPVSTITPLSQTEVIEIHDSPPSPSSPKLPSSEDRSKQDTSSQPGPSKSKTPPTSKRPGLITRTNLKAGTFIDLTLDDESSDHDKASPLPDPSRPQQPGSCSPQQPGPSRPQQSDLHSPQQPGPSGHQQPGSYRPQQPQQMWGGNLPPISGIPPIPPMPIFDNRGQQYPPVQAMEYMQQMEHAFAMLPPEFIWSYHPYGFPDPDYVPAARGHYNRPQRGRLLPPPPTYDQWGFNLLPPPPSEIAPNPPPSSDVAPNPPSEVAPNPPSEVVPNPPPPPPSEVAPNPPPPPPSEIADPPRQVSPESDAVPMEEKREPAGDAPEREYDPLAMPGGGTAYEFYEDMSRRMQPRLFETLIFSQNRAEFISGLNFLIQMLNRNMRNFPSMKKDTKYPGKLFLIRELMCLLMAISDIFPHMGFEGAELITYLNCMSEIMALYLELCGSFFDDESGREMDVNIPLRGYGAIHLMRRCLLNRLDYITYCIIKTRPDYDVYRTNIFWTDIHWYFIFFAQYSRETNLDVFMVYALLELFRHNFRGVNHETRREEARRGFELRYGSMRYLRAANRFIRIVARSQDGNMDYTERNLRENYIKWWSAKSACPGSSALLGPCGMACRTTSEDSWIPCDRRAEEENDEMSITFSERFYASEFYYGIEQTRWEIYSFENGINLISARFRTAGDRELARILALAREDSSSPDERDQPGPSGLCRGPNSSRRNSSILDPIAIIVLSDSDDENEETPVVADIEEPKTKDKRLARKRPSDAASASNTGESGPVREREVPTAATEVVESHQEQSIAEQQPTEVESVPVGVGHSPDLAALPKSEQTMPEAASAGTEPMPSGQAVVKPIPERPSSDVRANSPDLASVTSDVRANSPDMASTTLPETRPMSSGQVETAEIDDLELAVTSLKLESSEKDSTSTEVSVEIGAQEGQSSEAAEPTVTSTTNLEATMNVEIATEDKPSDKEDNQQSTIETSTTTRKLEARSVEPKHSSDVEVGSQENQSSTSTQSMKRTTTPPIKVEATSEGENTSITQSAGSSEITQPMETFTPPMKLAATSEEQSTTFEMPAEMKTQEPESSETTQPMETFTPPMKLEGSSDIEEQSTIIELQVEMDTQEPVSSETTQPMKTSTSPMDLEASNDVEILPVEAGIHEIESSESIQPTAPSTSLLELAAASDVQEPSISIEMSVEGDTQSSETSISPMIEAFSDIEKQFSPMELPIDLVKCDEPTETSTSPQEMEGTSDVEKSPVTSEASAEIIVQEDETSQMTQPSEASIPSIGPEATSDVEEQSTVESNTQELESSENTQSSETSISPMIETTSDIEKQFTPKECSVNLVKCDETCLQPTETSTSPQEMEGTSDVEKSPVPSEASGEIIVQEDETSQTQPSETSIPSIVPETTSDIEEQSTSSKMYVESDTPEPKSSETTQSSETSISPMIEATSDIEKQFSPMELPIDLVKCDAPMETSTSPQEMEGISELEKSPVTSEASAEIIVQEDETSQMTQPSETSIPSIMLEATSDIEEQSTCSKISVEGDTQEPESSDTIQSSETSISPMIEATSDIEKQFIPQECSVDLVKFDVTCLQASETSTSPEEMEETSDLEKSPVTSEVSAEIIVQEDETTQPSETSIPSMETEATSDIEEQSTEMEVPVEMNVQYDQSAEPTGTSSKKLETTRRNQDDNRQSTINDAIPVEPPILAFMRAAVKDLHMQLRREKLEQERQDKLKTTRDVENATEEKPSENEGNQPSLVPYVMAVKQASDRYLHAQGIELAAPQLQSADLNDERQHKLEATRDVENASDVRTVDPPRLAVMRAAVEELNIQLSPENLEQERQDNATEDKPSENEGNQPSLVRCVMAVKQASEMYLQAQGIDLDAPHSSSSSKTSSSAASDAELLWSSNTTTMTECPDFPVPTTSSSSSGFKEDAFQQSEETEKVDELPVQLEVVEEEPAKDESPKPAETIESRVDPITDQAASVFMSNLVEFLRLRRSELQELTESQSADDPETIVTRFQSLLEHYFREISGRPTSVPTDLNTNLFEALAANCPEGDYSELSDFIADLLDETKPEYNAALMKLLHILEARESTSEEKPETDVPETIEPPVSLKGKRGKLALSGNSSLEPTPQHTPRRKPARKKKKLSEASSVNEETLAITTTKGLVVPATLVAGQRRVKKRGKATIKTDSEVKTPVLLKQDDTTTQSGEPIASTSTQLEIPTGSVSEEPTASTSMQWEEPSTSTATLSEEPTASTSRKRRSDPRTEKKKKENESAEEKRKKTKRAGEKNVEKDNCMMKVLQRSDGQSLCNEISVRQSCELFEEVTEIPVQPEELPLKMENDESNHQTYVKEESGSDDFSIHSKSFIEDDRAETSDSSLSLAPLPYERLNKKKVQKYFNRKRRQFDTTGTCSSEADSSAWSSLTASTSSLGTTSTLSSSTSSLSSDSFDRSLNWRDPRLSGQSEVAKRYRQSCEARPAEGVAHEWRDSFDDATVIYNENFSQEKSALEAAKQTVSGKEASPKPTATSCLDFYNSFGREVSVDVVDETEVSHNDLINLASQYTEDETITINVRHILNNLKQEPVEEEPNQVVAQGTVFLTPEWDYDQANPAGYGNFNMPVTAASTSKPLKNPHLIENLIAIQPEAVPPLQQQPAVVFKHVNPPVNVVEKTIPEAEPLPTRTHAVSFFEQRAGEIYAREFGQQESALSSGANTKKYSWRDAAVSSLGPYHRPKTPAPSKSKMVHVTAEDNEIFHNAFEGKVVGPNHGVENEFSKLLWPSRSAEPLNGQVAATVKAQAAPIPDATTKENPVSILKKSKSRGDNKRKRIQFESPNMVEAPPLVDPHLNKLVDADCAHSVVQQPTELLLDYTFNNLSAVPINSNSQFISSNANASQLYPTAVSAKLNPNHLLNYRPNYLVENVMFQPQEEVRRDAALTPGGEEDIKEHFEEDYVKNYTGYSRGGFIGDTFKGQPPESAVMIKDNPFIGGHLEESRSPIISTGTTSPMLEGAYLNSVNLYEASRKETEHFGALPENVAQTLEKTLAQLPPKKRKLTEDQELAIYIQKFKEEKEQRPTQVVEEQISYPAQRQMSIAELHRDYPKTAIKTVAARKFYPSEPPNNPYFEYQQPYDQYPDYGNKRSVMNVYINGVRECSANYPLCLMIGTMHTCMNNQPNPGQEAAQLPPEPVQLPQQPPVIPPVPERPVVAPVKEPTRKRGRKPNPQPQQGEPAPKRGRGRPRKNPIT